MHQEYDMFSTSSLIPLDLYRIQGSSDIAEPDSDIWDLDRERAEAERVGGSRPSGCLWVWRRNGISFFHIKR
jgi:hypothetical protein